MEGSAAQHIAPNLRTTESTMFDRWVARSHWPRWAIALVVGIVLVSIPFVLAVLQGIGFPWNSQSRGYWLPRPTCACADRCLCAGGADRKYADWRGTVTAPATPGR